MKLKTAWLFLTFFLVSAIPMLAWATQVYHGDGATPGGATVLQWQLPPVSTSSDKCLSCHQPGASGNDKSSYLMTGHKNMLRKVSGTSPLNVPWARADGTPYGTSYATSVPPGMWTDPGNLSATFNWTAGTVTYSPWLGTGLGAPTTAPLFYIVNGWSDPTQMNSIFSGGFTGELPGDYGVNFPAGTYMCARCHVTGYQFDASGPEPTYNGTKIPDAQFSRIPTDFAVTNGAGNIVCSDATNTNCTSSWYLDAIQCERCHNADNGSNNHTTGGIIAGGIPTKPTNAAATQMCIECHRQETANSGTCSDGVSTNPADCAASTGCSGVCTWTNNQSITLTTDLIISGAVFPCSDAVSTDQATCASSTACTGTAGGCTWTYWGPATALNGAGLFFDTNPGQTFLNSPHARFNGNLAQNAQNSSDLSVVMTGTYYSRFQQNGSQGGCTTCHDIHQSVVPAVNATMPITNKCPTCHYAPLSIMKHSGGLGSPLNVTDPADACVICHMPSGTTGKYHLMRISVDPNYSTFPTPAQFYGGQTTANTASDGKLAGAVWADIDLVCGQCHGGSAGADATANGAKYLSKSDLAGYAKGIHNDAPVVGFSIGFGSTTMVASVNASATTCSVTCGTYDWDWGDGTTPHGNGVTATHTYTTPGPYIVKLTVTDSATLSSGSFQMTFDAIAVVTPPTASGTYTPSPNTWSVSVTDTSTPGSSPISQISVSWGDGLTSTGVAGATFNHTYTLKGTYTITLKASSTSGSSTTTFGPFTAAPFSISGNVYKKGGTVGLGGAMLIIRSGTNCSTSPVVTAVVSAATTGAYTTGLALKPGTYSICASKSGYTFNVPAATGLTVGPNATQNITATGP